MPVQNQICKLGSNQFLSWFNLSAFKHEVQICKSMHVCVFVCISCTCLCGNRCSSEACSHNLISLVVLCMSREDNSVLVSLSLVYTVTGEQKHLDTLLV